MAGDIPRPFVFHKRYEYGMDRAPYDDAVRERQSVDINVVIQNPPFTRSTPHKEKANK
jgi:hypothetical protein